MAVKRGLNMAKGLEALIPQNSAAKKSVSAGNAEESETKAAEADKKTSKSGTKAAGADKKTSKSETKVAGTDKKTSKSEIKVAETAGNSAASAKKTAQPETKATGSAAKKAAAGKKKTGTNVKKAAADTKKSGADAKKLASSNTDNEQDVLSSAEINTVSAEQEQMGSPVELRISQVIPNKNQPRAEFDEEALNELSESIQQYGVLQPLLVQKSGQYYEIIAGERRWRAAKKAGLKTIPVIIRDFSRQEVVEISLIENIQREDLNAIEEAKAYKRLLDEFDLKQDEVAKRVSKSRSAVTNSLRLLHLAEGVQKMLISEELSAGHARALLSLEDHTLQLTAAQEIALRHLSVRETEQLVKRLLKPRAVKEKKQIDTQLASAYHAIEERLTERMGTKVTIQRGRGKRGRIEIEYYSQEDLERIIELMQ